MADKTIDRNKLKICSYGVQCYRKNPIHFGEFSHPHLDKIYDNGPDPKSNKYQIPKELSEELISQQLRLLEKLFPKAKTNVKNKPTNNEITPTTTTNNSIAGNSKNAHTALSSNASITEKRATSPMPSTSSAAAGGSSSSSFNQTSQLAKKQKMTRNIKDYIPVVLEKGRMATKLKNAAPYNFFLTAITDSPLTHSEPLSVTMQEIFDESLGEIESTVQINFMIDIGWLLGHYYFAGISHTPLLVLYGDEMPEIKTISQHQPQVTAIKVNMPTPFATSHTKMMLIGYKDGSMRVVISTANLYEDDWHNRTQGVWISPKLPRLPEDADTGAGESPTNFKQDLMLYLVEYKIAQLQPWIARIRQSDLSAINVFFIGSVPGGFREGPRGHPWGHAKLGTLLQKHATPINDHIPIVCQSSSIGSLGPNLQAWIQNDFLRSCRKDSQPSGVRQFPQFKMIYPSFNNVAGSHDGMIGGGCLPYSKNVNDKQPWLRGHLHEWRSTLRYRSRAMPHIKTYTRYNLENQSIYWFCLTSANLSKAAWGAFNKTVNVLPCLRIANYEAGVLFLPKFITGEDTFPLGVHRNDVPPFPLPYDVPLTPYGPEDKPFLMDYLHM